MRWRVMCLDCMAMVDPGTEQQKYRAIEAWNRRAQPANEPLTLEQLRKMDKERVFVLLDDDVCIPSLVAYNTEDCDNEDEEDTVYLTNNLGGRSTYEDILDMGAKFYRRKPEEPPCDT